MRKCQLHSTIVAFLVAVGTVAGAEELSEEAVLADAERFFREGNEAALSDPARARELYGAAALKFEHLIEERGFTNAGLHGNLANTYFLSGDMGRAVLHYRRALRYAPGDAKLRNSLAYVRTQCVDVFSFSEAGTVRRAVFFWHYWFSQGMRVWIFGIAYVALWGMAGWRMLAPGKETARRLAMPARACAVVCVIVGVSALIHVVKGHGEQAGVVVAPEVVPRKGDSYIYEPAMTNALHSGAEFVRLQTRGEWVQARFANGEEAWLPEASVAMVVD